MRANHVWKRVRCPTAISGPLLESHNYQTPFCQIPPDILTILDVFGEPLDEPNTTR